MTRSKDAERGKAHRQVTVRSDILATLAEMFPYSYASAVVRRACQEFIARERARRGEENGGAAVT